ncbi:MAG: yhaX [Steroidobacteraceae bacterium]|jgi:HAD superfamily hydrolase (TIGR01484 family)|nr:yhaX [Steroidobacteraceae bacterium]
MRYLALCTDYDGTLAHHGRVDKPTLDALEELKASGRKLLMVTGREIADLLKVFDRLDLFELVVAENGATVYKPASKEERALVDPPSARFVDELRKRGVDRISVGKCIVATWQPHEKVVLETIRDLGLELQVIFNKGAVMVLPSGMNKAAGLAAALAELDISAHNAVGVGDAENDHAFLSRCEFSAAVANALPSVKETADHVLNADHGAGVTELIRKILDDDLASLAAKLARHDILLGHEPGGQVLNLPAYGASALIVGTSGGGKSTLTTGLIERLNAKDYSFCVFDPEGDYDVLENAAVLGSPDRAPSVDECMQLLAKPDQNAVINLVGLEFSDRPAFFMTLFARIRDLRAKTGRPHWLIVDEVHHVLPAEWKPAELNLPQRLDGVVMISVSPSAVSKIALQLVETAIVIGEKPAEMLREFAEANDMPAPVSPLAKIPKGEALIWNKASTEAPRHFRIEPNKTDRRRHVRKYAEGELPEERSFFFRGPEKKLNLRAPNLITFTQLADGVDADTWLFHWKRGDVSSWLRRCVKDQELTDLVKELEKRVPDDARASRKQVRELIEKKYTLPAEGPRAHKAE